MRIYIKSIKQRKIKKDFESVNRNKKSKKKKAKSMKAKVE